MQNIEVVIELFQHMNWADARVWKSVMESPEAIGDAEVKDRFYHIHATQHAFFQIWNESQIDIPKSSSFQSMWDAIAWAKDYYKKSPAFLDNLNDSN